MYKIFVVLAVCVAVNAVEYGQGGYGHEDYNTAPHYSFSYEVKDSHTGDYKSHQEERQGDHTRGVYSLIEPDGSKRVVEYEVAGKSGFNAKVHRDQSGYKQNGYNSQYQPPSYNKPSYQQNSYNKPSYHQESSYQQNSYNKPSYHQEPSYQQISYNKPSYQQSYHQPSYQQSYHQPSYQQSYHQPSYQQSYNKPSYGGSGHATSSVKIATHGAKIATSTYHHAPQKHY